MNVYDPFILVSDSTVAIPAGFIWIANCQAGQWYGPANSTRVELDATLKQRGNREPFREPQTLRPWHP